MLENTYSSAMRLMLGLPRETHRYFIEPLTDRNHIKSDLIKRFITFLEKTLIHVLNKICQDVRSVTGSNLRNLRIRVGKTRVEDITPFDSKVPFKEIPDGQEWRVNAVKELIEVQNEKLEVNGFESEEIETMLTWICTSGPS